LWQIIAKLSAEPLQECLKELLQVTTNDFSVDSLEKHLQQASISSSSKPIEVLLSCYHMMYYINPHQNYVVLLAGGLARVNASCKR